MGFKKVQYLNNIIADGVMTGTNVLTSAALPFENEDNMGIQLQWTGNPVGTFKVLVSNNGVSFYSLSMTLGAPAGSADGFVISLNQVPWKWVQLQYTNSSGVGVLNAWTLGKDLN